MLRIINKLFCLSLFLVAGIICKANDLKHNYHTGYTDTTLNSNYSGSNYGPVYTNTLSGKDSTLLPNAQLRTIDQNYLAYQEYIVKTHKIKNLITFSIDEESQYMFQSDFTASIFLDVVVTKAQGNEPVHFKKMLNVNYKQNPDSPYQAIDYYPFEDGVEVLVTVDSIQVDSTSWNVARVLKLKNDIQAQRDMAFDCHVSDNTAYYLQITNHISDFGEVTVDCFHPVTNFPNEYDIEWAWVDASTDNPSRSLLDVYQVFENNASRVTKKTPTYNIPLLYDGIGKLYVRYRCVQQLPTGQRLEGDWVYNLRASTSLARYDFSGHEPNLNWQATTSFAEDGKRKSVIQYFDGSLRGRQTVTKDNQTNTTIVAETFYDYQGRPVIQVLPAPTLSNMIAFTKNFNQFDDTKTEKDVYDQLNPTDRVCSKLTAKLKASSGASFYYSENWLNTTLNPNNIGAFDKFIPNADGRPYTETRYTNDGTGRIDAQGGVGTTHQINNGHDTKYLYESPNQSELDALFGTDAGFASHYFKNWVKDANGQYSVSYVDMHGRTVATSLAGIAPANLKPLDSETGAAVVKKDQLIDAETNTISGKKIVSSKSLVVPKTNDYSFSYSFNTPIIRIPNCDPTKSDFEYKGIFDVKIIITPDCEDLVPLIITRSALSFFPTSKGVEYIITKANTFNGVLYNQSIPIDFTVGLPEGSYTITKELTLNEAEFQAAKQLYTSQNICKTLQSFKDEQYALSLAQSNCGVDCASCSTKLGSFNDFKNKIIENANLNAADVNADPAMLAEITTAYNKAKENCDKLCNKNEPDGLDELRGIEQSMLNDMTPPYGQYAQPDKPNGLYSIFNNSYWSFPPYQKPTVHNIPTGGGVGAYNNSNYKEDDNTDANPQPDQTDILKFTAAFKHNYANQLLPYHPEYCKLITAKAKLVNAYKFEAQLNKINTWAEAVAVFSGKLTQTSLGGIETVDPFFNVYGNITHNYIDPLSSVQSTTGTYKQTIIQNIYTGYQKTKLSNNSTEVSLSMWQLAQMPITCRAKLLALQNSPNNTTLKQNVDACITSLSNTLPSSMTSCSGDLDMLWKNFKSFYLSYRRKLMNDFLNDNANLICPNTKALQTNKQISDASGTPRFVEFGANGEKTGVQAYDDIVNNFNNDPSSTRNNQVSDAAKSTCESNIENWKNWLLECSAIKTYSMSSHTVTLSGQTKIITWNDELNYLMKSMSKICQNGFGLMDHPLGASSIKTSLNGLILSEIDPLTGTTKAFNSIPQLLEDFFHTRLGNSYPYTELCHPYLITAPPPYENSTALINQYVITKPTDCECSRLNSLKILWQNEIPGITFSEYLKIKHATIISEGRLDTLSNLCSGTLNGCTFLPYAIDLPPVLQCKDPDNPSASTSTCISCTEYNNYKNEFKNKMPANSVLRQVPYKMPTTDGELNANITYAKFLNYKTGFTKTWSDYADFDAKCIGSVNCTILEQLLNSYYQTTAYLQNPTGSNCKNAFASYMNQALNVVYTYEQWMQFFVTACGRTPDVCLERITCDTIKKYAYQFYNTNSLTTYKNINCANIFATYFSNKLGKTFTYQQINQIAQQLNCCESDVCGFPNAALFGVVYKRFINQYSTTLWGSENCQELFTDYFNAMLGLQEMHDGTPTNTWSWEMIRSYYLEHPCTGNILNLCSPPFGCEQLETFLSNHMDIFSPDVPNCEQKFESDFNIEFHTSFIFDEIQDLYWQLCKRELPDCKSVFGCEVLAETLARFKRDDYPNLSCRDAFVKYFNDLFQTNYTYAEISSIYTHSKCVDKFDPCNTGGPSVTDCRKLEEFMNEFDTKFPNASEEYGANCSKLFLDYFCNYFNVSVGTYTVNDVVNMLNACKIKFKLPCSDNSQRIATFINNYTQTYSNLKLPVYGKRELFRFMYNKEFYEKVEDGPRFEQIYDICNNPSFLYSYSQGGYNAEYPCQTPNSIQCTLHNLLQNDENINSENEDALYDLKIAYYLMHPNGFAGDCQYDFANYFNLNFSTELSVEQVATKYENTLGEGASKICPSSGGEGGYVVTEGGSPVTTVQLNYLLCGNNVPLFNNTPIVVPPCNENLDSIAWSAAENKYELYLQDQVAGFETQFITKALSQGQLGEKFSKTYQSSEHHFTLYFYDQAGNLVKTVPPAGVDNLSGYVSTRTSSALAPTTGRAAFVYDVQQARINAIANGCSTTNKLQPPHTLATQYRYNTLNQVVEQNTPDAGISKFWYDRLGRLVVSQNAKQAVTKTSNNTGSNYSYTLYDELGRVSEVGQLPHTFTINNNIARNPDNLVAWMYRTIYTPASGSSINYSLNNNDNVNQVTRTEYDLPYYKDGLGGVNLGSLLVQKNVRNRVSYSVLYNELDQVGTDATYDCVNAATYYSYDIHGNVDALVQDFGKSTSCVGTANSMNAVQRHKKIEYNYDLISGKVNSVCYQAGQIDAFYHRYNYDAENRLINMETSRDAIGWQKDASYYYYKHGPLARTVLGDQQVQGIDYAYTLQGWLKGINSTNDGGVSDMGNDGKINTNNQIARDVYGFGIQYYTNDYAPISIAAPQAFASIPSLPQVGDAVQVGKDLFNGNIASITLNIPKLGNAKIYGYSYDQLNRLLAMNVYEGLNGNSNTFNTPQGIEDYKERLSYDANGNIKTYFRNSSGANLALNNYSYTYINGNNRLNTITNSVNTTTYQYQQDEIGNTTKDDKQNISNAVWNVYGKLQSAEKTDGTHISYTYNSSGQRISKTVEPLTGEAYTEFYVKDATGNTFATYKKQASLNSNHLTLTELNKYGSNLVGRLNISLDVEGGETITELPIDIHIGKNKIIRNQTEYYLYNHLNSPVATISDRKIAHSSNGTTVDYYTAVMLTASYYSTYGAISKEYNYTNITLGHNGQKLSKEISPTAQTALFWEYDADIARRWNVDPVVKANESPYLTFAGNPIYLVDINGDDWSVSTKTNGKKTEVTFTFTGAVVNLSSKKYKKWEMKKIISRMKKDIEATYQAKGQDVVFKTVARIREIKKITDIKKNEHAIIISDGWLKIDGAPDQTQRHDMGVGTSDIFGKEVFLRSTTVDNILRDDYLRDRSTVAHEIGHTGGLLHPDHNYYDPKEVTMPLFTCLFLGTWQSQTFQNTSSNSDDLMNHIIFSAPGNSPLKKLSIHQLMILKYAIDNNIVNHNTINGMVQYQLPQITKPTQTVNN